MALKSKGSKKKYKYKGRSAESVKKQINRSSGSFDSFINSNMPRFKPNDGSNTIRILPPTWDDEEKWGDNWAIEIWVHKFIGPDNSNFLCPQKMKGKPCAVCDARAEEEDEKIAKAMKVQPNDLVWLINRDDEKSGPQWWTMPHSKVAKEVASRSLNKKTGAVIPIDDPEEGCDVTFDKSGTGMKTQYSGVDIERDPTPLSESEKTTDKWMTFIQEHPLTDILVYHSYEHMEKAVKGKSSRKDEDEDEDDVEEDEEDEEEEGVRASRRSSKSKSKKGKSRRDEDEDEDEVDDEEEEDADEDERSSKRNKKRPSRDEEEDEEDEDEDEDEDERPKSKSKKRSRRDEEDEEDDEEEEDDGDEDSDDGDDGDDDEDESRAARRSLSKAKKKTRR